MEEKPEVPPTVGYEVVVPEARDFPLLHVNALNVRFGVDEFFLTLGVVMPPEFRTQAEAEQAGRQLEAQPVFRFAVSRQTMAKFLALMQAQLHMQTEMIARLQEQEAQEADSERLQQQAHERGLQ